MNKLKFALLATALCASVASYADGHLFVGDVEYTQSGALTSDDITNYVYYNAETKTLSLDNASINVGVGFSGSDTLRIDIKGNCNILGIYGMDHAKLHIFGTGSDSDTLITQNTIKAKDNLKIENLRYVSISTSDVKYDNGIYAEGSVQIENVKTMFVNAYYGHHNSFGKALYCNGGLLLKNSNIIMSGGYGICANNHDITIADCYLSVASDYGPAITACGLTEKTAGNITIYGESSVDAASNEVALEAYDSISFGGNDFPTRTRMELFGKMGVKIVSENNTRFIVKKMSRIEIKSGVEITPISGGSWSYGPGIAFPDGILSNVMPQLDCGITPFIASGVSEEICKQIDTLTVAVLSTDKYLLINALEVKMENSFLDSLSIKGSIGKEMHIKTFWGLPGEVTSAVSTKDSTDISAWFTNLPDGLSASLKLSYAEVTQDIVDKLEKYYNETGVMLYPFTLTIYGTPSSQVFEEMECVIPNGAYYLNKSKGWIYSNEIQVNLKRGDVSPKWNITIPGAIKKCEGNSTIKVYAQKGTIFVENAQKSLIYNALGVCVASGCNTYAVKKGTYIVVADGNVFKVAVY